MKKLNHLNEIIENYDYFIIDLWGVVHNGITPFNGAMKAIEGLHNNNKKYYLFWCFSAYATNYGICKLVNIF